MSREELKYKLQEIFADVFADENIVINESTSAKNIEAWDSLTNINILAAIQDEFMVSFEIEEIVSMKNVGDMLDAVLGKL